LRTLAVLAALALGACAARPLSHDAHVTLTAGGCFGSCPVYKVKLDANDLAVFEGERNVAQRGRHQLQLPPGTLRVLLDDLEEAGAFQLAGLYTPGSKNCGRHSTDYPSKRFEIYDGRRQVIVDHYLGCRAAPAKLLEIEKMIEDRTQARYWIDQPPAR